MPYKFDHCFDRSANEQAKLAEENKSWVPNFVQDIYHSMMDKKPEYPQGVDKCGFAPISKALGEGEIKNTFIISDPNVEQSTLKLAGAYMDFHVKGPVRIDEVENKRGKIIELPGEVKAGVPNRALVPDTFELLTFNTVSGQKVTTHNLGHNFELIPKVKE